MVLREEIAARLSLTFQEPKSYRELLRCRGQDAQELLDLFQWILDSPDLSSQFRRNLIVATQRISAKAGLYPRCYELNSQIQVGNLAVNAGSFADIYKGTFCRDAVCIKVMRVYESSDIEHVMKLFSREIILWGQLSHPNILPVYGLYRFQDRPCLVAPWIENGDVNRYLKHNPTVPRLPLALGIARGLYYLHQNGIIHGDLKGPNILIGEDGRPYVADFGISSISDPQILAWTSHSSASSKGGSVRWQAPELFDLENDEFVRNSEASDVYAWSCVCYEIFTGHIPFDHLSRDPAVMYQVKSGARPARPPDLSPPWNAWGLTEDIWRVMEDCWKESPGDRPSIGSVIGHLGSSQKDPEPSIQYSPTSFRTIMDTLDSPALSARILHMLVPQEVEKSSFSMSMNDLKKPIDVNSTGSHVAYVEREPERPSMEPEQTPIYPISDCDSKGQKPEQSHFPWISPKTKSLVVQDLTQAVLKRQREAGSGAVENSDSSGNQRTTLYHDVPAARGVYQI